MNVERCRFLKEHPWINRPGQIRLTLTVLEGIQYVYFFYTSKMLIIGSYNGIDLVLNH
jgi:hypothetical protein